MSPDGSHAVFVRDWNLWLRDMKTGQEKALTSDGVKYFGYATDNAGWSSSDRAIVAWSPDSKKIATQQQDERNVGEMYPRQHGWARGGCVGLLCNGAAPVGGGNLVGGRGHPQARRHSTGRTRKAQ